MAGMTSEEIEARKAEIVAVQEARHPEDTWVIYHWHQLPGEITELRELSARDMINACLIYGEEYAFCGKDGTLGQYARNFLAPLDDRSGKCTREQCEAYALTPERLRELFNEQRERFARARVHAGVATGPDGESYNSVDWDAR